ncbi:MAG: HORMA domain containing protein [Kineosporiaceae bacterium]|nr:HORMA domain containing protein [Kineosporiaceae bacterium]
MSTRVTVSTSTHATTYVADKLLYGVKRLVRGVGLPVTELMGDWAVLEKGIARWLATGHLTGLVLEIYAEGSSVPSGLVGRFDFGIDYGYVADGGGDLWFDTAAVAFALKKAGVSVTRCTYRVIATTAAGRPDVEGWSSTTLRSTAGFTQQPLGTAITGGSLGADLSYFRRTA